MKQLLPPSPPLELLEQATLKLNSSLQREPHNVSLLHKLAVLYRKQGLLPQAAEVYARILSQDPADRHAGYLLPLLSMGIVSKAVHQAAIAEGMHAAPFVLIEYFLPPSEHAQLLPLVLANQDEFQASLVGDGQYRPETRESRTLPGRRAEKKRFRSHITSVLPEVIQRLGHPSFAVDVIEVKIRAYSDGDFFEVHQDCSEKNHREISYVYFFHREPRGYRGGDLLLIDTDIENDTRAEATFTRIVPRNNSVVFFPSCYYHTVIPVSCPSGHFGDGRFVINGHVQRMRSNEPPRLEAGIDRRAGLQHG